MKQTLLLIIAVAVWCVSAPTTRASAEEQAQAIPAGDVAPDLSARVSHWGALAPMNDSTTVTPENRKRAAWEYPLLVPYVVVDYPLRWTAAGLGYSYISLEESGFIGFVERLIGPRLVPWGFLANFKVSVLSGIGGGLSFYHNRLLHTDTKLKVRTFYSTNNSQKYSIGMAFRPASHTFGQASLGYRLRPKARYFGIGPDASDADESFYTQESAWVGASIGHQLTGPFRVEATGVYSSIGTRGPGDEENASIEKVFTGTVPFGQGLRSQGVTGSLEFTFDSTTDTGRPQSGTLLRVKGSMFSGFGDDTVDIAFNAIRFDAEQFIPLWHQERALALRLVTNWIENQGRDEVPFQRLLTNDEPDLLRGFIDLRWRDKGIALFSAEYRWPWWADRDQYGTGVHMYLFSDVGQVFDKPENIDPNDFQYSYGVGWRLLTAGGFVGRMDLGWSDEDFVLRLAAEQTFQYSKGGLYNARDKSLLR